MLRSIIVLCDILFVFSFLASITCKRSYSIIAPGTIRSNRKYTVCTTLHNISQPATLLVGLRHNSTWSEQKSVSLQPMESKLVDFFPPKLDLTKQYELFVEGVEGLYFYNSTQLLVGQREGVNIYIETDRGTYKPGDLLRFRVVILNEHAKPVKIIEPIKVQIFDGLGNRVKQFKDISLIRGVYTNELQLSKEPVLGIWTIKVFIGGKYAQEKLAEFKIDRYTLPKFVVNIETQNNVLYRDNFLKISVSGRYTYNKFVEGKASLRIRQTENGFTFDLANYAGDTVDSKAIFEIDLNDFSESIMSNRLIVTASLKEKQTGTIQSATTEIYLLHEPYNITLLDNEIEFENEKISMIKIKIQHWNNTAVRDHDTNVFIKVKNSTFEAKLDDTGVATLENELEEFEKVTVEYKNTTVWFFLPGLYGVETKYSNCDLKIKNKKSKLGLAIYILVEFKRNIPYLVYTLTAHGNIITSEFVYTSGIQNSHTIQLLTRNEMVPVSYLYVHFMYGGIFTFCEMKIELPEKLENEFSVSALKNVKPGQNVTITLKTQPGSHVALTAVDLSSVLLNKGNRVKKADIMRDLREEKSYTIGYAIHPGIFSGLVTLTDIPYLAARRLTHQSIPSEISPIEKDIRSFFPETWIFSDLDVTEAMTIINFTLPDSITTWVLTGFSVNEKTGIGLLDADVDILAFKPFFVSIYLPYSIKKWEIVSVPVVVSNYHSESLTTEVVLENRLNEFQFVDNLTNKTTSSKNEKRNIIVPANSAISVMFLIKAQKLGPIDINVQATNKVYIDKVLQKLLVEADGLETSYNHEIYIHLKRGQNYTTHYKPDIPPEIESDTEYFQLSISGDILLPSLNNIGNLVDVPKGCGEQNMINFVPNILVLEYLSATSQNSLHAELVEKARNYTEIGFQQQLKFRHSNGGYSVFGPDRCKTTSNWLTAYVVRFFIKGMKYFSIETKVIDSSLKYLADTQLTSGEFPNAGYLFQQAYKNPNSFTAFVLLSFLENTKYAKKYKTVIQKALNFLSNNISDNDDIYSLAIMAAAFQTAKHEQISHILDKLTKVKKTKNDLQWWHDPTDNGSTDVEITSYILLALLQTPGHYLPIAKWLMEQRNTHGGFKSTQSTVLGLQALIKYAQFSSPQNDTSIEVLYTALDSINEELENGVLSLDQENLKSLQHYQLPSSTRSLQVVVLGTGSIFLQFSYNYRMPFRERTDAENDLEKPILKHKPRKTFLVKRKAESTKDGLTINLEICVQYTPSDNVKYLKTNMIIAEVNLPSGYVANEENIEELRSNEDVDRIENETPDKLIFYLTYTEANEEKCIELVADNKHEVKNLKPSLIIVYEYYHSSCREVVTYTIESNRNLGF